MAPIVPTIEPTSFAAGETVSWTRVAGDFPVSEGYTLKAYFAGPSVFTVEATVDGDGYLFEILPATTSGKTPGTYLWRIYAEKGEGATLERYLVADGTVVLDPDFTTAVAGTHTAFAETMVAAIRARMEGRLEADLESYGLAGRQAQMIPYERLHIELGIWNGKLYRAQNPGKRPTREVRFVSP